MNAVRGKEGGDHGVEKLGAIVGLHCYEWTGELCADVGDKINKGGGGVGFVAKRERPHIMREVVHNNKIVLKTKVAQNRRCPKITMH